MQSQHKAEGPVPCHARRYNLTQFAIQLNEVTPGLEAKLAPTDCRLRPDQHYLELGCYDQVGCVGPAAGLLYGQLLCACAHCSSLTVGTAG
jgi:hypothetical protein